MGSEEALNLGSHGFSMTCTDTQIDSKNESVIITREEPGISIIIPCKTLDVYTKECIDYCLKIEYPNYEILVLPDYYDNSKTVEKQVRIIPTGPMKPMLKRLIAGSMSKGTLCAFIDSDAFPTKNWLRNAIRHFNNSDIAAVVGPSLTPNEDSLMARASGLVLASFFGGGLESIRYGQSHIRYVTEAPTCNLIIRKFVLNDVKNSVLNVWPGEEIALCGIITNDLKKKIVYDPQIVVYHHRRPLFIPHLKQIWSYGLIKGLLLKPYHKYVKLRFLAPSLLVSGIISGFFLAMVNPIIKNVYTISLSVYVLFSFLNSVLIGVQQKSVKVIPLTFVGAIATHISYGLAFIKGIFSKSCKALVRVETCE